MIAKQNTGLGREQNRVILLICFVVVVVAICFFQTSSIWLYLGFLTCSKETVSKEFSPSLSTSSSEMFSELHGKRE